MDRTHQTPNMDIVFHGLSAATLAYACKERRKAQLIGAAVIGILPDVTWPFVMLGADQALYSFSHSLILNIPLCFLLCFWNRRIAYGGLLHVAFDVFTHQSSTMNLFYPWAKLHCPIGISWWQGPGLIAWLFLWSLQISFLIYFWQRDRNS